MATNCTARMQSKGDRMRRDCKAIPQHLFPQHLFLVIVITKRLFFLPYPPSVYGTR